MRSCGPASQPASFMRNRGAASCGLRIHSVASLATELILFGIASNTLVRSSQSSSGPAGGASDGYGLGRGAAGPDRRCTTTAAGAVRLREIVPL